MSSYFTGRVVKFVQYPTRKKNMRIRTTVMAFVAAATFVAAQELPLPSPLSTVSQRVGLTDVSVAYSRPSAKERVIFGNLVPYGDMWRTGANKNTTIEFSTFAFLGGSEISPGKYSLFTVPGEDEWEIIINSKNDHSGTSGYSEEADVARFKAKVKPCAMVETFSITFENLTANSVDMVLSWEKTHVSFEIKVDPSEQAITNINEAIASDDADFRTFNSSARYYLDNNLDAKQAVQWAKKSVALEERFWNVHTLAKAYAAAGNVKDAITTAEKSMQLSNEADYEPYVKMNEELIAKLKGK